MIAVDANCFTYMIDALSAVVEPTDVLAPDRKALVWLFFQDDPEVWIAQENIEEIERIPCAARKENHLSWLSIHFRFIRWDEKAVSDRAATYLESHDGRADCRAVAQASLSGCEAFLTCDRNLISRLGQVESPMRILRPSDYWTSLPIPRPSPRIRPAASNPLADQAWIRP